MAENIIIQRWKQFIQTDTSSGIILVLTAVLALIMANSYFSQSYNDFLEFPVNITLGAFAISKPLVFWVNNGLMVLFSLLLV
jgi:NhaA family Na+:H+ antiporter